MLNEQRERVVHAHEQTLRRALIDARADELERAAKDMQGVSGYAARLLRERAAVVRRDK